MNIQTAHLHTISPSGHTVEGVIVWCAPLAQCPTCHESTAGIARWDAAPVVLSASFRPDPRERRHGCGTWVPCEWEWVPDATDVDDPAVAAAIETVRADAQDLIDRRNHDLDSELRLELKFARWDLADGEFEIDEVTDGSETNPGVWVNDAGDLEAWAYDAEGDDIIVVTEAAANG